MLNLDCKSQTHLCLEVMLHLLKQIRKKRVNPYLQGSQQLEVGQQVFSVELETQILGKVYLEPYHSQRI